MDQRFFVTKREGFRLEAEQLRKQLERDLRIETGELQLFNGYEVFGADETQLSYLKERILFDPVTDELAMELPEGAVLAMEYLPGQYDQRADSAEQCLALLHDDRGVRVKSFRAVVFVDGLEDEALDAVRKSMINPIEMREKDLSVLSAEEDTTVLPVPIVEGFIEWDDEELEAYRATEGFSLSTADMRFIRDHYRDEAHRDPTIAELRVLDTYWSDHCRHTTFETELTEIEVDTFDHTDALRQALDRYHALREETNRSDRPVTLMDMATLVGRAMRKRGELADMEVSDEINAASIEIEVDANGTTEPWLLQFKNETHNHPTEIEPFGGASTCIGGAIRDPLSGRAYVTQALRITGAADITAPLSETLEGKLPQSVISKTAAQGYSSYGNQIGVAATYVEEIYHPGFVAKRMELGAVAGASPKAHVRREAPVPGDVVLLIGGATGRDGVGGATGSSREHTRSSLEKSSSEVQKGNAPEEHKLQRLYRDPEAARCIKKSNDFGAGGVSVAIGEMADGVQIDLDAVPVKYQGLDGTELAISESQERMAVVIAPEDLETFLACCDRENVPAAQVAVVTENPRVTMTYRGQTVVDLPRAFLNTNGVRQSQRVRLQPEKAGTWPHTPAGDLKTALSSQQMASQQGMVEMFDSTVGRSTVQLPYGGKTQRTRSEGSVQRVRTDIPSNTAAAFTYGYDPYIGEKEPFLGAQYAVIEALARQVALGAPYRTARLTCQEYFERLGDDPAHWGKVVKALLGLLTAQEAFGTPAIGGKDSMSGSFHEWHVPPTLVAFAITAARVDRSVSAELKKSGSHLYLVPHEAGEAWQPNYEQLKVRWDAVAALNEAGQLLAAATVKQNDVAATLATMAFGNEIGFEVTIPDGASALPGSLLIETREPVEQDGFIRLGTTGGDAIVVNGTRLSLEEAWEAHTSRYAELFPLTAEEGARKADCGDDAPLKAPHRSAVTTAKPRVLIPLFPGTNCEFDTKFAFEAAGAQAEFFVLRTQTHAQIEESMQELAKRIRNSQILSLVGGFSAGDEPDGSGKFIVSVLHNPVVREAVEQLLESDGLILGICNGFQALVKSGLLPGGKAEVLTADSPTLFRNKIGRHVSRMVHTRVVSANSPWMASFRPGDTFTLPVSHGEGRFVASDETVKELFATGCVASVYADSNGQPALDPVNNPNGSVCGIEAITSPDGRILGRMAHAERYAPGLFQNIPGEKEMDLFANGVRYFTE